MKIRIMLSLVLIALIPDMSSAGQDWRLDVFDRAQKILMAHEYRERDLFVAIEPRLADFYSVYIPIREAEHRMLRYAFLKKLSERPDTIEWKSTTKWLDPVESSDEEDRLAQTDPEFAKLRTVFREKRDANREKRQELVRLRNKIYNTKYEATKSWEDEFIRALKSLQSEVDLIIAKGG